MVPVLFAMPGNEAFAARVAQTTCELGQLNTRRFPDGEAYIRLQTPVEGRDVIFVCTLDRPDEKLMPLYFAACTARELGARRIGLVAPYLSYMRQDSRFHDGEGITSGHFGRFVSSFCDWLITVDPHLHRHNHLDEVYPIPTKVVAAAPSIASWLAENIRRPVVIGPDAESEQWAAQVAKHAECPWTILKKTRTGDREVEISIPDTSGWEGLTPVVIDDIASTARTMMGTVTHLKAAGLAPPVCIAVHPVFAGDAYAELAACGVERIVSCNTIVHPSNAIDISSAVSDAICSFIT